ncbi:ankyrin repeat-containing [Anaeramoeba ignava]|uniref:Ankyrin repeat-containing n=1 Tax=Anaeramoeba ignava TaxID=1746090 RepID=A0A9Q0LGZ0_ANAIG|nr:ankyrin repeat-containing [Anaeramoeba ignava]
MKNTPNPSLLKLIPKKPFKKFQKFKNLKEVKEFYTLLQSSGFLEKIKPSIYRTSKQKKPILKNTSLHNLCENKNVDIPMIQFLLDNGNSLNEEKEMTPFHVLCMNKSVTVDLLKFCLDNNAILKESYITPFHLLCTNKSVTLPMIKLFPLSILDPKKPIVSPLQYLCENESINIEILEYFVSKGCDFKRVNVSLLYFLARNKSVTFEMLKLLIDNGAEINNNSTTPFHNLCGNPSVTIEMMKLLLENGAEIATQTYTTFHSLCGNPSITIEMMKFLLENGAKMNTQTATPLTILCNNEKITVELLDTFISESLSRNEKCSLGQGLFLESKALNIEIIEYLFEKSPDLIPFDAVDLVYRNSKIKNEENTKIIDYLVDKGYINPSKNDKEKIIENVFEDNLELFRETAESFHEDFLNLFERSEFTDFQISKFKVHRLMIEIRTGKKAEEVREILSKFTEEEVKAILIWIYTGKVEYQKKSTSIFEEKENISKNFFDILTEIGISNPQKRSLKEDIMKLYYDEESKDFVIEVQEKEIKVHKLILQTRSELFRQMFLLVQDDSNRTKDYTGKNFHSMNLLVKFLYSDKLNPEDEDYLIVQTKKDSDPDFDFNFLVDFFQLNPKSKLNYYEERVDPSTILGDFFD